MTEKKKLLVRFGDAYGVDPKLIMGVLKSTAFKTKSGKGVLDITDAQMMALLIVADQHNLNPFTREIFAFPDKNKGIVPVVSVDGWAKIINDHPQFDGMDFEPSENTVELPHAKPCPEFNKCIMHRKDRKHPTAVTEYLDEVYRMPFVGNKGQQNEYTKDGAWQTHTKRMLRHKTMIQAARLAFSFSGIYDEDEAHRIVDANAIEIPKDDFSDVSEKEDVSSEDIILTLENLTDKSELDAMLMNFDVTKDEKVQLAVKNSRKHFEIIDQINDQKSMDGLEKLLDEHKEMPKYKDVYKPLILEKSEGLENE